MSLKAGYSHPSAGNAVGFSMYLHRSQTHTHRCLRAQTDGQLNPLCRLNALPHTQVPYSTNRWTTKPSFQVECSTPRHSLPKKHHHSQITRYQKEWKLSIVLLCSHQYRSSYMGPESHLTRGWCPFSASSLDNPPVV